MIINWADFKAGERKIDICIVGGGAAGLTLADTLRGSGLTVLVLEAGGLKQTAAAQEPYRGEVVDPASHPWLEHFRVRAIGGASRAWGGRCLPFDPIDFEDRPWVPGPGWPIDLQSLTEDYQAAQVAAEAGDVLAEQPEIDRRQHLRDRLVAERGVAANSDASPKKSPGPNTAR